MRERLDWAALLASEAKIAPIIRSDELVSKYRIPHSSVVVLLKRQERRGLVERVSGGVYINKLAADVGPRDLANVIRPNSYVSLDSALLEWGISTQSPVALTCVSTSYARTIRTSSIHIEYRKVKKTLFWGFTEKKSRYGIYKIAEPEKAVLDWLYFRFNDGLPTDLDELQFQNINPSRAIEYAKQYPRSVLDSLIPALLKTHFTAQTATS